MGLLYMSGYRRTGRIWGSLEGRGERVARERYDKSWTKYEEGRGGGGGGGGEESRGMGGVEEYKLYKESTYRYFTYCIPVHRHMDILQQRLQNTEHCT